MLHVGLFFLALFFLFLLSRRVTRGLSFLLYRITKRERWAVGIMAFIFLPGTILHEVSHFTTALLLGVHAGKMEFRPEIHENSVKMGSVSIAKTDVARRFLIGVAPIVWGTGAILVLMYFAATHNLLSSLPLAWGVLSTTFVVGNTMYSSKRDMEGALGFFIFVAVIFALIAGFFLYTGISFPKISVSFLDSVTVFRVFETGWKFLLVPIGLDIVMLGIFQLFLRK